MHACTCMSGHNYNSHPTQLAHVRTHVICFPFWLATISILPDLPPQHTAASPVASVRGGKLHVSSEKIVATVYLTIRLRGGLFWHFIRRGSPSCQKFYFLDYWKSWCNPEYPDVNFFIYIFWLLNNPGALGSNYFNGCNKGRFSSLWKRWIWFTCDFCWTDGDVSPLFYDVVIVPSGGIYFR